MTSSGVEMSSGDAMQELARRVTALEHLTDRIPALEREVAILRGEDGGMQAPATTVSSGARLLERVWHGAPLPARLEFLRKLEPGAVPDAALHEAGRLLRAVEERERIEDWIQEYPSVFAESFMVLSAVDGCVSKDDRDELTLRTLGEARHRLEAQLRVLGVEWIEPAPGDAVTEVHSVADEAAVPGIAPGRVSVCRRRGFLWKGKVHLPALVARQPAGHVTPPEGGARTSAALEPLPLRGEGADAALVARPDAPAAAGWAELGAAPAATLSAVATATAPTPPSTGRAEQPAWLVSLQQSIPNGDRTTAGALTRGLADLVTRLNSGSSELPDYEITVALKPLLALLGTGAGVWRPDLPQQWTDAFQRGKPELLAWLSEHLALEIFVPAVGEAFSLETMQMTTERRTAHPHEWGTVARVEAPGLVRGGQVLLPARVVRYESGGGA